MRNFAPSTIWIHDCLPLMRRMNSGCVNLLYMDPPFNSNMAYHSPLTGELAYDDVWPEGDAWRLNHANLQIRHPRLHGLIEAVSGSGRVSSRGFLTMMAPILMEAWRVVSVKGNLVIHCDPQESANLTVLMDMIAGAQNRRATITWERSNSGQGKTSGLPRNADFLLHYARRGAVFNKLFTDCDPARAGYLCSDSRGPYAPKDLGKPANDGTMRESEWTDGKGALRSMEGGYLYRVEAGGQVWDPPERGWRCTEKTMKELVRLDLIHFPNRGAGRIRFKRYASGSIDGAPFAHSGYEGTPFTNVWTDIGAVQKPSYPTQKPRALMERLVDMFSDPGGLVFDPFCGSGSALKAARRRGREWAGCDQSAEAAAELRKWAEGDVTAVLEEMESGRPSVNVTSDLPVSRTDLGKVDSEGRMPAGKRQKILEAKIREAGVNGEDPPRCAICRRKLKIRRDITLDHIVPVAHGGPDSMENLQLACGSCNGAKGTDDVMTMLNRLRESRRAGDRDLHADIVKRRRKEGLPYV